MIQSWIVISVVRFITLQTLFRPNTHCSISKNGSVYYAVETGLDNEKNKEWPIKNKTLRQQFVNPVLGSLM